MQLGGHGTEAWLKWEHACLLPIRDSLRVEKINPAMCLHNELSRKFLHDKFSQRADRREMHRLGRHAFAVLRVGVVSQCKDGTRHFRRGNQDWKEASKRADKMGPVKLIYMTLLLSESASMDPSHPNQSYAAPVTHNEHGPVNPTQMTLLV